MLKGHFYILLCLGMFSSCLLGNKQVETVLTLGSTQTLSDDEIKSTAKLLQDRYATFCSCSAAVKHENGSFQVSMNRVDMNPDDLSGPLGKKKEFLLIAIDSPKELGQEYNRVKSVLNGISDLALTYPPDVSPAALANAAQQDTSRISQALRTAQENGLLDAAKLYSWMHTGNNQTPYDLLAIRLDRSVIGPQMFEGAQLGEAPGGISIGLKIAEKFQSHLKAFSETNLNKYSAILMDNEPISAPKFTQPLETNLLSIPVDGKNISWHRGVVAVLNHPGVLPELTLGNVSVNN